MSTVYETMHDAHEGDRVVSLVDHDGNTLLHQNIVGVLAYIHGYEVQHASNSCKWQGLTVNCVVKLTKWKLGYSDRVLYDAIVAANAVNRGKS